jgi:Domain of unknown function (DUF4145)
MRDPPSSNITATIIEIMRSNVDDRSAALTAGALADTGLMVGIANVLRPDAKEIDSYFWTKRAKYRTFATRIDKAASLGLIGAATKRNLNVIRQVRNAFAHSMIEVTFATPPIEAACSTLTLSKHAKFFVDRANGSARCSYCYACDAVFRGMLGYAGMQWLFGGSGSKPSKPVLP